MACNMPRVRGAGGIMPHHAAVNFLLRSQSRVPRFERLACSFVHPLRASNEQRREWFLLDDGSYGDVTLSWMRFPSWEGYLSHELRWIDRSIFSSAGRRRGLQAPLCAEVLRRQRHRALPRSARGRQWARTRPSRAGADGAHTCPSCSPVTLGSGRVGWLACTLLCCITWFIVVRH
jgi:hypothetical protein